MHPGWIKCGAPDNIAPGNVNYVQARPIIAIHLFVQAFRDGAPAPLPYQAVLELLQRHGKAGRGPVGDTEIAFEADQVAHYGLLIGDARQGAQCVAFVRPIFDDALRHLVFELMTRFEAAVFDDALGCAYVAGGGALPEAMAGACVCGVQRISSPQQLWPAALWISAPGLGERPALLFKNPNPQGLNYVLFDRVEMAQRHLHMEFDTRASACNPGTLRALRNVLHKVDTALAGNPDHHVSFHFIDPEANLQLLESPKIAEARAGATMVVPGEAAFGGPVAAPGFNADADCFFAQRDRAADCLRQAKAHGLTIPAGLTGAAALDRLLAQLHQVLLRERGSRPAGEDRHIEQLQAWARLAGACLGEMIRTGIGGQWGVVTLLGHRFAVVHTHTGRNCWPSHFAFHLLMNGAGASVASYLDELTRTARSPTPRNADIAADIPAICHILLGHGQFGAGGLPLQERIPVAQLDYSLHSLQALDGWLAAVHAQRAGIERPALSNLILAAGAYLGECVRRNAAQPWHWTNYDDFFSTRPANPNMPKDAGTCAFLLGPGKAVLPMQTCNVAAWGEQPRSVHAQALQWLGDDARKPARPQAPAALQPQAVPASQLKAVPAAQPQAAPPGQPQPVATPQAAAGTAAAAHELQNIDVHALFAALKPQERPYTDLPTPLWIDGDDLQRLFDDQPKLLQGGRVVWAHLVQANNALFAAGQYDSPGEVVYDPGGRLAPEQLAPIAQHIFKLKGTQPADPDEARIARHLTNEMTRAFAMPVPRSFSADGAADGLLLSTVLIARKHLPNHRLSLGHFPVLVSEECRGSVMILPGRWWPRALAEEWGIEEAPPEQKKAAATPDGLAPVDPPNVRAAKDQVLHVVKPPVPFSDDAAWAHLDESLAREQERLLPPAQGVLGKFFKRKAEAEPEPRPPDPLFAKYIGHMLKEYSDVCNMPEDLGAEVLSLVVASGSVNYVVETARREFGLTVFDANSPHFNIVYRPAKKPAK